MKWVVAVLLAAFLAVQCLAATTKKHPAKKPASTHSKAQAGTKRTSGASLSSHARGKSRRHRRAAAGPALQSHPDPERYQQIQQALADRGYYKGEVNGQWDADSVDALKRFQTDQKLDPDGKINALSLIGLGLGPKHEGNAFPSTEAATESNVAPLPPVPAATPSN